ncbi:MAG: hypothetical protein ACRDI2_11060 [Chloroflexota bacterium]
MNVLDENITDDQRQLQLRWRIHVRQIGHEVGRAGAKDDAIIPILHGLRQVTFFTRDQDFDKAHLCHGSYCLVYLAVRRRQTAEFIRRFPRHPAFDTRVKREGLVARVSDAGIHVWRLHGKQEDEVPW